MLGSLTAEMEWYGLVALSDGGYEGVLEPVHLGSEESWNVADLS